MKENFIVELIQKNSLGLYFKMKYKSSYKNRTDKNSKIIINKSFKSGYRNFYSTKKDKIYI